MGEMRHQIVPFALREADPKRKEEIQGEIEIHDRGIDIRVEGYGDHGTEAPYGCPIYIELYDGRLRVLLWKDINKEDPEIHFMDGAKESAREPEPHLPGDPMDWFQIYPGSWWRHRKYTFEDWQAEAQVGGTRLGYMAWVKHQIEEANSNEK